MPFTFRLPLGGLRTHFQAVFLILAAVVVLPGCSTMYVDNGLKDVSTADYRHPTAAQPTQLLFSFETKGAPNSRATGALKDQVLETVKASQLFSSVSLDPVPGGSLLSVVINNVPVTDNAFSKGFATGLTFGLAGNVVTDGYICTVDYSKTGAAKIEKSTRHAIHTTIGAKGAPANATKAKSPDEAVKTMTRQIVGNALKDLSADPQFAH
jgi:hypothetical protein